MEFRRLIAFVLSLVIVLSGIPVYASAHDVDDTVETILSHSVVPFETMVVRSMQSIGNVLDTMQEESFAFIRNVYEFWSGLFYEGLDTYFDWVSGLDRSHVQGDETGVYVFGSGFQQTEDQDVSDSFWRSIDIYSLSNNAPIRSFMLTSYHNYGYFAGVVIASLDDYPVLHGAISSSLSPYVSNLYPLGTYVSESSFSKNFSSYYAISNTRSVFLNYTDAYSYRLNSSNPVYFLTPDSYMLVRTNSATSVYSATIYGCGYLSSSGEMSYNKSFNIACYNKNSKITPYVPLYESASDLYNSTSRPTSLMSAINQYNIDNSYTDNSTNVNYYIVPTGVDPSADTAVSPAIYDEETLVYTDPVTGTEYLTNGWTYDYLTRCYTLDMADDSYLIGDTVIDTIKLTYGDELLTVDHYSSGSLIQSDEYNYVMMSGSECSLTGHSYSYETVKDPTCTTMGERKYTCSVCGDEYAENVPASGHAHVFSVLKEPTCTASGIGLYSCSSCGSEYTEPIPATDHVSTLLETVPSEFDENGVLISVGYSVYECSVCGTQYTVQDEISTDDGDWFSFMGDLLKSFLKTIVTALGAGLSKLFSAIADFFSWIFGFLSETVLSGIKNFFNAFGDDSSIFDGFRQENEDGSSTVALPSGVATVFRFVSGTILLLPDDLRLVLIFGVAALFLIAVFKSRP